MKIDITSDLNIFYKKIRLLKFISHFKRNFIIKYKSKEYKDSFKRHPDKIDEILKILDILNTKKRKERYNIIYDYACDYLDNEFINNNWCNFKNNMCISNRNKPKKYQVGSCCTRNYTKMDCEYFDNTIKRCSIKCISCKLFVCNYLSKKGIKYRVNSVIYLKYFLSLRQKLIASVSFFKPKDVIINKWLNFYKLPIK